MYGNASKERKAIRMAKLKQEKEDEDLRGPGLPAVKLKPIEKKLKLLRCVTCKSVPFPTQYRICEIGHIICNSCAAAVKKNKCPGTSKLDENSLCRKKVARLDSPLELYESIYKQGLWRCPYFRDGCQQTPSGTGLVSHAQSCEYRPCYPCVVPNCGAKTESAGALRSHLRGSHDVSSVRTSMKTFHVSYNRYNCTAEGARGRRFPQLLEISSVHFLVAIDELESEIRIWLWHFSDHVNSTGFQYRLLIHGNKTSIVHVEWTGESMELPSRTSQVVGNLDEKTCLVIKRKELEEKYLKRYKRALYWTAGILIDEEGPAFFGTAQKEVSTSISKTVDNETNPVTEKEEQSDLSNSDEEEEDPTSDDSVETVLANANCTRLSSVYLQTLYKAYLASPDEVKAAGADNF